MKIIENLCYFIDTNDTTVTTLNCLTTGKNLTKNFPKILQLLLKMLSAILKRVKFSKETNH